MGLAVLGADEFFDLVREGQQAEQIALLFRRQAEHQRGGDEALQHRKLRVRAFSLRSSRALNRDASTMT